MSKWVGGGKNIAHLGSDTGRIILLLQARPRNGNQLVGTIDMWDGGMQLSFRDIPEIE